MSELDICNAALAKNHHLEAITNSGFLTTPVGKAQILCARFYDQARKEAFRLAPWTCIKTRVQPAANTTADNFTGLAYAWDLPDGYVNQIDVTDTSGNPVHFEIEAGVMFTDCEDPVLIYVPDETDDTKWDPILREVVVSQLASKLSYPLTGAHDNEIAYAKAAIGLASIGQKATKREHRQGPPPSEPWVEGLFDERRIP